MKMLLSNLIPNEKNSEIYSNSTLTDLKNSLERYGQLEPIVINKTFTIISGHRRFYSMKQLGWTDCEVRVETFDNELISLIEFNRTRTKTRNDILREASILEEEIKRDIGKTKRDKKDIRTEKDRYRILGKVADKLGVGLTQMKQLKSIQNYEPNYIERIDKGELSVSGAYKLVQQKHIKKHKQRGSKETFSLEFRRLLGKYRPTKETILDTLKITFPYSMIDFSVDTNNTEDKLNIQKSILIDHLSFLKSLDAREYTLYKKLVEFEGRKDIENSDELIKRIWKPTDLFNKKKTIKEIESIKPKIVLVEDGEVKHFDNIRRLISTMEWKPNPGRLMRLYVMDEVSDKILGIITLASDVSSHSVRDEHIGWSQKVRMDDKRINYLANGTTIVPTQPFGFNFLGGKLVACMVSSPQTTFQWETKYKEKLAGITTTSLYGSFSQYTNIPLWKHLGRSKGEVLIIPDEKIYKFWRSWLKFTHPKKYDKLVQQSSPKQKHLGEIFRLLGINKKDYLHHYERGVYFSQPHKNGLEYLNGKINHYNLNPDPRFTDDYIDKWWKPKAVKRYENLYDKKELMDEVLWYEDFSSQREKFISWLEARGKTFYDIPNDNQVSVPLMITKQMRVELLNKGFSETEIKNMKPEEAHQNLS